MTNTTTKKFNTFMSRPLQDSVLGDIPGVGKSSLVKLLSVNMDTPEKLMGLYLFSSRNPETVKLWLISNCTIRAQEAGKISEALDKKAQAAMLC
jgi:hypothetical protein